MPEIRHPEYRAELENTKYPFVPAATLTNGEVSLLEGTFLDAHVYALDGGSRYYISKVVVTSQHITLHIGNLTNRDVASGRVSLPVASDTVSLTDAAGRPAGIFVSEPSRLSLMIAWGIGTHLFELRQTELAVTCHMPVPSLGVTGFKLPNGEILTGKVWFVGDDGVMLQTIVEEDKNGNPVWRLQVNVVGDPLYLQKLCNPESLFVPVNPVRVLRIVNNDYTFDCYPDDNGNFSISVNDSLAGDTALRVRTSSAGIVFEVEGSTPNK